MNDEPMKVFAPKVEIHTMQDTPEWFVGQTTYIATVDIRLEDGRPRTCAGFGITGEQALINLVKWLAGAGTGWNLEYQHPVVFE